jgi:GTPase SAR1 family protein
MPTELVNLELEEVSLVDMGDDPLAKVALYKRSPEGEHMENEDVEKLDTVDETEKGYKEEDMKSEKMDDMEDDEEDMMEDEMEGKKPTRKSWKAEAIAFEEVNKMLLEEIETYKAKVAELEAVSLEKAKPQEEMIEVEGEMIAKSAIPTPILKKLEEMQKAVEAEALRKRADEVLPNFKGTADERGKLLKSIGTDEALLAILRAADAASIKKSAKLTQRMTLNLPRKNLTTWLRLIRKTRRKKTSTKRMLLSSRLHRANPCCLKPTKSNKEPLKWHLRNVWLPALTLRVLLLLNSLSSLWLLMVRLTTLLPMPALMVLLLLPPLALVKLSLSLMMVVLRFKLVARLPVAMLSLLVLLAKLKSLPRPT